MTRDEEDALRARARARGLTLDRVEVGPNLPVYLVLADADGYPVAQGSTRAIAACPLMAEDAR